MDKKAIETGYTPEQIAEMKDAFQNNDFTAGISLGHAVDVPAEGADVYYRAKAIILGYWKKILPTIGITRMMSNFSKDHPVKFLENVDATFFSEQIAQIASDEGSLEKAVDKFIEMYREQIELGIEGYAKSVGKAPDELTDDEIRLAVDAVTGVMIEEFLKVMMLGQQVPEIFGIARKHAAHEDFNTAVAENHDRINFRNRWTRCKTLLGAPLLFSELIIDENDENDAGLHAVESAKDFFGGSDGEDEREYNVLRDKFLDTLDETERKIYTLLESGNSQRKIAEQLGYKSHTSVSRSVAAMRQKLTAFLAAKDSEENK